MSSTTQKHRNLVAEPMGNKPVTALPGIGKALDRNLRAQGFDSANQVLGQYLVMKRDPVTFTSWLKSTSGANTHHAEACTQSLSEWCENNL
ncbi:barrier-to-autointegration factor-like [Kryptolebias marmoratus]|nr:barrier-to-autointegration factor-like [Kryptolebias marmoratus]